jgi:RNA polymerase sigma factor (sigma-70 family)
MATAQLGTLLRHIEHLAAHDGTRQRTDRELLDDFAAGRDEAAFAALVARHGPMVLRVCRRVLHHEQDAEDAFQAAFLVLARGVASIRDRGALASFLHGVAFRTAMKARRSAARRRDHEARLRDRPNAAAPGPTWNDVQTILDEEVQRLPEAYRSAFVLCALEGKSVPEASDLLGWKAGTVSSRLARARQRLRLRLARRGIKLAAVLAALSVVEGAGRAAVPAVLARVTVRSGLLAAAGETAARDVPSHVAELAAGVTGAMFLTRARIVAMVLLAVGVFAAGAGVLARQGAPARETATRAAKTSEALSPQGAAKPHAAKDDDRKGSLTFAGRVVGPDGKPAAGATVSVWTSAAKRQAPRAREVTGKDGRFRVTVRRADLQQQAVVVATAKGYGPDWAELNNRAPKDREVTLRLARDDVAINGRLRNLEGRGVAGVVVQVRRVEKRADGGDLAAFIATKQQWARGNYVNGPAMKNLVAEALPMATSVTTDADGRFRLSGFGRERVVHLQFGGGKIEPFKVEALTRTGPVTGLFTGNENDAAVGATFERLVPPCKSIVGTAREKAGGKPAAGVTVYCGRGAARTDARGRYRIDGVPKKSEYTVTARGVPYFVATKSRVADTPGFEPVGVDFDLERGLAIRGRVFDKKTGKPVMASVTYHAFADNPSLKKVTGGVYTGGGSGADGSFAVTGLPGPGVLAVLAEEDDYLKVEPGPGWELVPGIRTIPNVAHAFVRIDPSEKDLRSATFAIALGPAATVKATVVGPDGKPSRGYYVAGMTASPRVHSSSIVPQWSATFAVRGLDVRRPRTVVVFSPEKKLGAVLVVRGDEAGPLQVRLRPLGSLTGRVLGADRRPRAGLRVHATLSREGEGTGGLPVQFFFTAGRWLANLEPKATTDEEGKFRLDGLLPGLKYTLVVSEGGPADAERVMLRRDSVLPPEAGRIEDLGDVVLKQLK